MPSAFGLFAASGAIVALTWLVRHRERLGVSENEFWAAVWLMLVAAIVGAKALFVGLGWQHYARGELQFWRDFRVGFVWWGGFAGALIAGLVFAHWRRLSFARGADDFGIAVPLGHAVGRVGCFVAGCCHGRDGHPVQLYEAAGLLLVALASMRVMARVGAGTLPRGSVFRVYLVLYGLLRVVLDPLRGDGRPERWLGLSHQQGIALAIVVAALAWRPAIRPRPAIVATAMVLVGIVGSVAAEPAFDHARFDRVLQRVVDGEGRVDYRALKEDTAELDAYVTDLAATSPDSHPARFASVNARLAYWVNAYNASVMAQVVRRYPIASVRSVFPPLVGFFNLQKIKLGGTSMSLYALENSIVRPRFQDPRAHFALNCASKGCPRLPTRAFTAEGLDGELDREARRFVAEPRNVQVDAATKTIRLSSIFDWYDDDFTTWMARHRPADPATLVAYVRLYADPATVVALDACRTCEVTFVDYDWGLNDQAH